MNDNNKIINFLKNLNINYNVLSIISLFAVVVIFIFASSYASNHKQALTNVSTEVLKVDEEAYGENIFDSTNLDFRPILDNEVNEKNNNVIYITFNVGGSLENKREDIIYDIALADLKINCELLSPYLKWKLVKNNELISEGSLDYKFDTIKNGRLVLTSIQQDLKKYSEDKTMYDNYEFYMWLSDSCQEEDIELCLNKESQDNLTNKIVEGKIEVELYVGDKKELVRQPSNILSTEYCMVGGEKNG